MKLHSRIAVLRQKNEKRLTEDSFTLEEAWTHAVSTEEGRDLVREYYRQRGDVKNVAGYVAKLTWRWVHEGSLPGEHEAVLRHLGYRPIPETTWYVK